MKFTNKDGAAHYGRYRIIPDAGNDHLTPDAAAAKGQNYLFEEITDRILRAPVKFRIAAQLADPGDTVDDATVHWPEGRRVVDLGDIELTALAPDNASEQHRIIFDPIPRLDGIEPSDDPLLELRAAVYLISGRRRRAAPPAQ